LSSGSGAVRDRGGQDLLCRTEGCTEWHFLKL
jgi:hypothetical protein